jgi:hypothetical protein
LSASSITNKPTKSNPALAVLEAAVASVWFFWSRSEFGRTTSIINFPHPPRAQKSSCGMATGEVTHMAIIMIFKLFSFLFPIFEAESVIN